MKRLKVSVKSQLRRSIMDDTTIVGIGGKGFTFHNNDFVFWSGEDQKTNYSLSFDNMMNLRMIQKKLHSQAKDMGWHNKPREIGTMIALCHSELSEALEGARKDLQDDHLPHRKMVEVELADCIIRILDLAEREGYDVAGAIVEKHEYNRKRADHQLANREKEGGKKF